MDNIKQELVETKFAIGAVVKHRFLDFIVSHKYHFPILYSFIGKPLFPLTQNKIVLILNLSGIIELLHHQQFHPQQR